MAGTVRIAVFSTTVSGHHVALPLHRGCPMPRGFRNLPPGSIVHAMNRGNDKRALFERGREFDDFLDLVVWAKGRCPVLILAYCIMSNHWHFVLWSQAPNDVARFLHRLTGTHAMSWRRRTGTIGEGHVYGDRFKSKKVFTEAYYFTLLRYVEQNPWRAGLVRSSRDWRWSSLTERLGATDYGLLDEGPGLLPPDWHLVVDEPLAADALNDIRSSLRRY